MTFQDRGPPKQKAAGDITDGQELSATETERKVPEHCIKTPAKSRLSVARHERVATALKGALASDHTGLWRGFVTVLMARLTLTERAALAFSALRALPPDEREATCLAAHPGAGMPIAPLFSYMSEAELWAEWAAPGELDAYCLAAFKRMVPGRRAAFLKYIGQGGADGA